MIIKSAIFIAALVFCFDMASAQSVSVQHMATTRSRKVYIDPSSTTVSLGKVSLNVSPLSHVGKFLIGEYAIKVVPYFYKNEKGALELEAADDIE
ncbi:MAG: hypothetical protein WCH43_12695, partial [Verrucomicrobiota bacterium]